MKRRVENGQLELAIGDITQEETDAIVNAANSGLRGGGGVDGAIHRAAGPSVMQQTRERYPDGCPTGSAVLTDAGDLPARYIIHAVGPVWRGGRQGEADSLRSAFQTSLQLAADFKCESIAFPAISTGVYNFPLDLAAEISLDAIRTFLAKHDQPSHVRVVLFDEGTYGAFARVLEEWA